jgi:hypothetical protein
LRIILLLMFLFSSVSTTITVVPTATLIGTLISMSPKYICSPVFQDIDENSQYDAGNSIMTDIIFFLSDTCSLMRHGFIDSLPDQTDKIIFSYKRICTRT